MSTTRLRHDTGFTLLEVLVVVAVIAVLMAILLPSLKHARDAAKGIQCLSNLRQMAIASHSYANANEDLYPIAYYMQMTPQLISFAWDFTTTKDWSTTPPTTTVKAGLLWQNEGLERIQQCPSFDGGHNWVADPFTGYNYNTSYIGHGAAEAIQTPATVTAVTRPARTALFGDGEYGGGANKFMRAPWSNPGDAHFSGRFAGTQGYRHRGRTNVAFCDGHGQQWGELHTNTYENDREAIAPGTGFLSEDNSLYDLD